jgi:hypothetical protein
MLEHINRNCLSERHSIMETVRAKFRSHGLVRTKDGRVLGGVIAGLARPAAVRPRTAADPGQPDTHLSDPVGAHAARGGRVARPEDGACPVLNEQPADPRYL